MEILLLTPGQEQPITSWLAPADKNFLSLCEGLLRQSSYRIRKNKNCAFWGGQCYQSISALVRYYRS
jgi:hypothetical protein